MKARRSSIAILLAAALIAGCTPPERSILDRFFSASRLRDKTALGSVATVIFEPLQDGIVTSFEIVRIESKNDDSKTVTIEAPVKMPDGQVSLRSIDVTLERRDGRWLITSFGTGT